MGRRGRRLEVQHSIFQLELYSHKSFSREQEMRIASFPVERAEINLHTGSLHTHLQDSVPNHKIICKD